MAENNEELDLASLEGGKEQGSEEQDSKGGGLKKIILMVVAFIVVAGGGAGAALFFAGGDTEQAASGEETATVQDSKEDQPEEDDRDALYLPLDPPFIANAKDPGSRSLMQIRMQVMSYDQEVIDKLRNNMALVRDAVIMLLSAQDFDRLGYPEEKQRLRGEIKRAIEGNLKLPKGGLEAVLFTEFILE